MDDGPRLGVKSNGYATRSSVRGNIGEEAEMALRRIVGITRTSRGNINAVCVRDVHDPISVPQAIQDITSGPPEIETYEVLAEA